MQRIHYNVKELFIFNSYVYISSFVKNIAKENLHTFENTLSKILILE